MQRPACRAMLSASRQTLKGWVVNEKGLLEERHREIAGIVLRGLRTLSMALKWYRDAKTRVLWRPASVIPRWRRPLWWARSVTLVMSEQAILYKLCVA